MNSFKLYLSESWRFIVSPREEISKVAFSSGYISVFFRTLLPILVGTLFASLSFKKIAFLYVFAGGSVYRLLFQVLLPDSLLGILYAVLFAFLYLALGSGILYAIGKISSGKSDLGYSLETSARFSVLFILLGFLQYLDFEGIFGGIIYTIYFIYFSYIIVLILFYGIHADKRISIVCGLALGLLVYSVFLYAGKNEMSDFIAPSQPQILTPEEEQERIKDAEEMIRKLEEARKARGYKD